MKTNAAAAIAAFMLAGGSVASAIVVNFDDVPSGTSITNQYPELTFSYGPGVSGNTLAYGGVSPPNILCTLAPNGNMCVDSIFVDFTSPVNNLTFLAIQPNEFGVVAEINVFTSNAFAGTIALIGLGATPGSFGTGNVLVDLTSFSNVTRIEVVPPTGQTMIDFSYGGNGIGYDVFSFDVVPAPGTAGLLLASLGLAARRRR